MLEEASFYECSEIWWERPLDYLQREIIVRKLPHSPHYEIRVMDVANFPNTIKIASAMTDDFTGVAVFTNALEKSEDLEKIMQEREMRGENESM